MRPTTIALLGLVMASPAVAQTRTAPAKNTPEGIVCAMTGSCDAAATSDDGRLNVGDEKAFSLARLSGAAAPARAVAPRTYAPARSYVGPGRSRPAASNALGRGIVSPAHLAPDGGLDMEVTFARGSANLTPQARAEAKAFATALASPQMAGRSFAVEGHTDSSGSRQKNIDLSQARAQSVVDYLVSQGADPARLKARGYGPDKPLPGKPGSAPANRRVEFVKS